MSVSPHSFADPLAVKSMYWELPVVYLAYFRLIDQFPCFFITRNPKLEPMKAAPVSGSESGTEQDAGSVVNPGPHERDCASEPAMVILLPGQFGLK